MTPGEGRCGLERFEVPLGVARNWKGLGGTDAALVRHLQKLGVFRPERMFCYLPVGSLPVGLSAEATQDGFGGLAEIYYKRIDLVVWLDDGWFVIEVKPSAGYIALGQVLTYTALARRAWPALHDAMPGIVTDCPDPDLRELCEQHCVRVWRDPDAVYVPQASPR